MKVAAHDDSFAEALRHAPNRKIADVRPSVSVPRGGNGRRAFVLCKTDLARCMLRFPLYAHAPRKPERFARILKIEGVWVTETRCATPVAIALRQSLIELSATEPFTAPLSAEVRYSDSFGLAEINKASVGAASRIPWRHVEQAACRSFRDEPGLFRGARFWGAPRAALPAACDDSRTCGAAR
jgi:hypothetical protein